MTARFDKLYGFVFPDNSYQSTAVAPNIATGQTWQNMSGQRVVGITYRNTTTRPIQIMAQRPGGNGATLQINVGSDPSNLLKVSGTSIDQYGGSCTVSTIVPPNYYYTLTGSGHGGWYESR